MSLSLTSRLFDAADAETLVCRILGALASGRGRQAAYAEFDAQTGTLSRRWCVAHGAEPGEARIALEPYRLHPLLRDDATGSRPLRPGDNAAPWVVAELLPGADPRRDMVRVRAISDGERWLGVLGIALPRGPFSRTNLGEVEALGDVLELGLARLLARPEPSVPAAQPAPPPPVVEEGVERALRERVEALEAELARVNAALADARDAVGALDAAYGSATATLIDMNTEMVSRTSRLRRQTRLLYLFRKLLDEYSAGVSAEALATELVRFVSESSGGSRCSLLLGDPEAEGGVLRVAAARGLPESVDPRAVRVSLGSGIAGRVARTRTPVVVRDPVDRVRLPLVADEAYTGDAFVSLPVVCQERVVGVLNVTNFAEGTFDDSELAHMQLIAGWVALMLEHAQHVEREPRAMPA